MKKTFLISLFVLILFTGSSQTYDVLFIGNSYTYSNNLPQMLRDLALSNGDTVNHDSNTPGGYTYELHTTNSTTIAKIKEQKWDFVVLQEQSQRPSFPPSQVAVEVYPFAAMLDSMIKTNDICIETVFFMTWGRKYGDQANCQYYPPVCTYAGMQQRLRESYLEMGNTLSATVAPVGIAWKHSIEADSMINLFMNDNSHPSVMGTYLAACVFYATFYQESPVGLPFISTLSQATASFLQNIAANTVLDSLSTWNINANLPKADFTWSIINNTVSFLDNSVKADKYYWDFGDGNSDTVPDPKHTYAIPGKYIVILEVSSACASDTKSDTVEIITSGLDHDSFSEKLLIFPNPAQDNINVQFRDDHSKAVTIKILDVSGKNILTEIMYNIKAKDKFTINTTDLSPGTYFIQISGENINLSDKIFIY